MDRTTATADFSEEAKPPAKRQIIAGDDCMKLEMYDWQVYGFMEDYLGAKLFQPADPYAGLLSALQT